jgi:SAM-dependent methyltransferase
MLWSVYFEEWARATLRDPLQHVTKRQRRECPVCGFHGLFIRAMTLPVNTIDKRCPNCSSLPRHRRLGLFLSRNQIDVRGKHVLHLSPERCFWRQWRDAPNYVSGDVKKSRVANTTVDVTNIQFPDNHFDYVFCNHILEHVPDDRRGMHECFRVLKPDGLAVFSVPLFDNGRQTFEPPPTMPKREVERICGWDHKRIYGLDFVDRLAEAGFTTWEIMFSDEDEARHRVTDEQKGEQDANRVFVAGKTDLARFQTYTQIAPVAAPAFAA